MKDYYRILGVDRQATPEEIKKAYRRLAKQYHPDVVKDDKARQDQMYQIQEAYSCLGDEERRKKYDAEYIKSNQSTIKSGGNTKGDTEPSENRESDRSRFERFFGFQPGKGMETYQDKTAKKPEGPINAEELFASFFGGRSMQEAEKKNTYGKKSKTTF